MSFLGIAVVSLASQLASQVRWMCPEPMAWEPERRRSTARGLVFLRLDLLANDLRHCEQFGLTH